MARVHFRLALAGFRFVYADVMAPATGTRFESPKITLTPLLVFQFGAVVGPAYIAWTVVHFDAIFHP